jgi:hypothetical protein
MDIMRINIKNELIEDRVVSFIYKDKNPEYKKISDIINITYNIIIKFIYLK